MFVFAQAAPVGPAPPPPAWIWGVVAASCACYVITALLALLVLVFFLRTLARVLDRCDPDLREMEPGEVWLNLIPVFNVVWLFVTVVRVADSLRLEFADRRLDEDEDGGGYGKALGLVGLVTVLLSCGTCCLPIVLLGLNGPAPAFAWVYTILRFVIPVVLLTLFVLYWVRIAGYGRQLVDDDEAHEHLDDRPLPEEPTDADRR